MPSTHMAWRRSVASGLIQREHTSPFMVIEALRYHGAKLISNLITKGMNRRYHFRRNHRLAISDVRYFWETSPSSLEPLSHHRMKPCRKPKSSERQRSACEYAPLFLGDRSKGNIEAHQF
jgi:hypothetical protein